MTKAPGDEIGLFLVLRKIEPTVSCNLFLMKKYLYTFCIGCHPSHFVVKKVTPTNWRRKATYLQLQARSIIYAKSLLFFCKSTSKYKVESMGAFKTQETERGRSNRDRPKDK